jgi:pimeloyl-ACP methyl ester carboxylesterase
MRGGRRSVLLSVSFVLLVGLAVTSGSSAVGGSHRGSTVDWRPCRQGSGFPFECARVRVPLDYSNPDAGTISIAMIRLPATDQPHKIGSLFLNPGGPGGSGVRFARFAAPYLYGGTIQSRFDIVGFDPRGIERSKPLHCFDSPSDWRHLLPRFTYPITPAQEERYRDADLLLSSACRAHGGAIMDHMATADVVRDLDRLRQAVGDSGLNYMGVSYGSFLGVSYANMFPNRVRAVIVDAVLDPIAWTTGVADEAATVPVSTRVRSDQGAQTTLTQFFELCDAGGHDACSLAPHAADRFERVASLLRDHPVHVIFPGGEETRVIYQDLIVNTLVAMYETFSWPFLAKVIADIEAQVSPRQLGRSLRAFQLAAGTEGATIERYRNFPEGFPGVLCSDSMNPTSYNAWSRQGAIADERFGYFGRAWTWASSICATWPGFDRDRYLGPFDAFTAEPLLVIGNLYDPATRYEGAQLVHRLMPNSSLLTLRGWGHASLFLSRCIDRYSVAFLKRLETPEPGTICDPDQVPFQQPPGAVARTPRTQVIPNLVPPPLVPR